MVVKHHDHAHPHRADMLTVEDALKRVLELVRPLELEEAPLLDAQGQVLAEAVHAPFDIPGLANSAMDGYAVRHGDVAKASPAQPAELRVVGQVQAGHLPVERVSPGAAVRIMTGAPVPEGADIVVPYELTDEPERLKSGRPLTHITVHQPVPLGCNIRPAGEDLKMGDLALAEGRVLDPPAIGMLASLGRTHVRVVRRPRVAILATGDEVQAPGTPLKQGRLYDSNSYGIAAAVRRYGGVPHMLGIARDNMGELRQKLGEGLQADMLITSAGVSGGAYDMVKDVLRELGSISFWSVRMRPSKPLAFGLLQGSGGSGVPHLGLPGNPASALVALIQFARPALMKMMGRPVQPLPAVEAVLEEPIVNSDGRRVFARVTLERRDGVYYARLTGAQGSNLLTSMVEAQGLAICPEDVPGKLAGDTATVQLLDWADYP
jgi:molybdopterin molybdotransferase